MSTDIYNDPARRADGGPTRNGALGAVESAVSAVSWAAILAGAAGAAALAMILVTLGAGLGLLAVSPWSGEGATATTIGVGVIVWSIIVHGASFGLGGYLAGRLRTKWSNIHGDEVYFRDTAHGFATWAVGILVSICIMTSIAGEVAKGTASAAAAGAGGMGVAGAAVAGQGVDAGPSRQGMTSYFSDMLLRPGLDASATAGATTPTPATGTALGTPPSPPTGERMQSRGEIGRILTVSLANGDASEGDKAYLAQLVANETGMTPADAQKRVDDVIAQAKKSVEDAKVKAKQVADDARKAAAGAALWAFVAMLVGAFCASYAATIGGRARDL